MKSLSSPAPPMTQTSRCSVGHPINYSIIAGTCHKSNGIGTPKDLKTGIFQSFFATKQAGEWISLGLSRTNDTITFTIIIPV